MTARATRTEKGVHVVWLEFRSPAPHERGIEIPIAAEGGGRLSPVMWREGFGPCIAYLASWLARRKRGHERHLACFIFDVPDRLLRASAYVLSRGSSGGASLTVFVFLAHAERWAPATACLLALLWPECGPRRDKTDVCN